METDWTKEEQIINLNILVLTHFTKVFAQEMVQRRSDRILNLASTIAFQPGSLVAGKMVAIHGNPNWLLTNSARFALRKLITALVRKTSERENLCR